MLVVADDLTGAADAAGAFAIAGHRCIVSTRIRHGDAPILAIDTNSRTMSESAAFEATAEAVRLNVEHIVFVKIDSTLRGHVKSVVEGALSAMPLKPSRIVVCPAFPDRGRTVLNGWVHVDGTPIDGGNLRDVFTGFPPGSGLFVPTIRSDDELAGLVQSMDADVLWVGSAGVARHLAPLVPPMAGAAAPSRGRAASKVVVVAGSQHQRTIDQFDALDHTATALRIDPRETALSGEVAMAVTAANGLVLTGGATARAVLDLLGVTEIDILGEVEPGIPWGTFERNGSVVRVVTKAGGFGDVDALQHAVEFLGRP